MDLDELISNTADGVCAITTEGKISLWNRSAEKILGYPVREVLGRPCCQVFLRRATPGNDRARLAARRARGGCAS